MFIGWRTTQPWQRRRSVEKVAGGEASPSLLAMLYGQTKLYKTSVALAAPKEFRPIGFLDLDRGARLRLAVLGMTPEQRKAHKIAEAVPDWMGPWMKEGIDFLYPDARNMYEELFVFANQEASKYKLVVLDSGSRCGDGLLKEVSSKQYGGVEKETKRMSVGTGVGQTFHPTQSDYGFAQDRLREIIKALDRSTAHVLVITHERTAEFSTEDGGVKRIIGGPRAVGRAMTEELPSIMDLCVRVEAKRTPERAADGKTLTGRILHQAVMRTRCHNIYLAGDRSGLFADEEPLDARVFWEKVKGLIQLAAPQPQGGK